MKKIIIADDEDNIRILLRTILGLQYDVVEAESGSGLVEKTIEEKPDLIITDIHMPPGKDGLHAVKEIKGLPEFIDLPVIFISALLTEKLAYKENKPQGPSCFMDKPFSIEDLRSRVEEMLEEM